jgi:hypothetical protein
VPTAGKTWAKERDNVILNELPKLKKGWSVSTATYDPCVFIIKSPKGQKVPTTPSKWAENELSGMKTKKNIESRKPSLAINDLWNHTYISVHTDDFDCITESMADLKEIVSIMDNAFSHNVDANTRGCPAVARGGCLCAGREWAHRSSRSCARRRSGRPL